MARFKWLGGYLKCDTHKQFDARMNCVVAMVCVAISQILIMSDSMLVVGMGMAIFGMANGIITVTFGYVPNLYFRPAVFGRAKGWIATPKAIGSALGPALVLALFQMLEQQVFYITMALSVVAACLFAGVLRLPVRTEVTTG